MIEDLSLQRHAAELTLSGLPNEHFILVKNAELGAGDRAATGAFKNHNSTVDDWLESWITRNIPESEAHSEHIPSLIMLTIPVSIQAFQMMCETVIPFTAIQILSKIPEIFDIPCLRGNNRDWIFRRLKNRWSIGCNKCEMCGGSASRMILCSVVQALRIALR
jgi:hypothetical protein